MDRTNDSVRKASGTVRSRDPLVTFLYVLLRDHLPAGEVEGILEHLARAGETVFTNGWLARYAMDVRDAIYHQHGMARLADGVMYDERRGWVNIDVQLSNCGAKWECLIGGSNQMECTAVGFGDTPTDALGAALVRLNDMELVPGKRGGGS